MNNGYEKVKHLLIKNNQQAHSDAVSRYMEDPNRCLYCNKVLEFKPGIRRNKFCNQSCAAAFNNKGRKKDTKLECSICGKQFKSYSNRVHCSGKCIIEHNHRTKVSLWLSGELSGLVGEQPAKFVKRYLKELRGWKCELCGWDKINSHTHKIPITTHHIDGNYANCKLENLQLLCPNCHSLTSNYGSRNKGSGRKKRYKEKPNGQIQTTARL